MVYGEICGFSSHTLISFTFIVNVSLRLRQFYWDGMLVNHTYSQASDDAGQSTLDSGCKFCQGYIAALLGYHQHITK